MAFYRITPGPKVSGGSGPPLASDVNQITDALVGNADAGALSLAAPVAAPTVTSVTGTATGGAGLGIGVYTMALTYITGDIRDDGTLNVTGETIASATWTATTTSGNQQITNASLPVPAGVTIIGKRLYRTVVGGAQLNLVATLATSVTSYVDTTADASLGANVPTSNTTGTSIVIPTLGRANTDVTLVGALLQEVDTRSVNYTWSSGQVSSITIKDGSTTLKTISFTYTGAQLTSVAETVGGKTITSTFTYNPDGTIASVTRTVA